MTRSSRFRCALCEFTCGKNEGLRDHLLIHGHSSIEKAYVAIHLGGESPLCRCGCGQRPKFIGWNKGYTEFLKGHNGRVYSSYTSDEAEKILSRRAKSLTGKIGWSRGRTKESDPRLAQAAQTRSITVKEQFRSGGRVSWSKGKSHKDDPRISRVRDALIDGYKTGKHIPWAKGQTKSTDERVAAMAQNVSQTMSQKEVRERLDAMKRLSDDEIQRRLKSVHGLKLVGGLEKYKTWNDRCLVLECESCGHHQNKSLIEAMTGRCDKCSPAGSKAQVEIDRYIRSLGFETQMSTRSVISPYEIDTFIPSHKFGIEYNGLYFHSSIFKNKRYHSNKTKMCEEKGVRLIHIFEDEWRDRRPIVESMIAHYLDTQQKIDESSCRVTPVSKDAQIKFFDENHISGYTKSNLAAGLISNNGQMVACMSLKHPHHKKYENHLEVSQFCTALGISVSGAINRLSKWAAESARDLGSKALMTYVNTQHDDGVSYTSSGWQLIGSTTDRFWWTDGRHRIDRFKIRADKSAGLSESDVAAEHGVVKIWGCPNLIMTHPVS